MKASFLDVALVTLAFASPSLADGSCQTGYTNCSPAGATSTTTPQIGSSDFANLFNDLIASSLPKFSKKRDTKATSSSLCCVASLSCLTLSNLAIPFCYDKFTTNFVLPDGSYGTVATGAYTSSSKDTANLETGDFSMANGSKGNIYSSNPAAKPNIANLAVPSQFTSSGVRSAIPVTALGGFVTLTFTTTLPASTISATTILPTTIPASTITTAVVSQEIISTSISGSLVVSTVAVTSTAVSTVPASTISGVTKVATTVADLATTVTTTSAAAGSALASTTKKSSGERINNVGISSLCGLLVVAVFFVLQ